VVVVCFVTETEGTTGAGGGTTTAGAEYVVTVSCCTAGGAGTTTGAGAYVVTGGEYKREGGELIGDAARVSFSSFYVTMSYGLHVAGWVDKLGLRHNGPRFVIALGTLIMASGPALCSPLNGVGLVGSKPQAVASAGLLNQNPTWKVFVGG